MKNLSESVVLYVKYEEGDFVIWRNFKNLNKDDIAHLFITLEKLKGKLFKEWDAHNKKELLEDDGEEEE